MYRKTLNGLFILVLIAAVFFSGCTGAAPGQMDRTGNADEKMTIAVSVLPQTEFVGKVGGDRVKVISLLPVGADCCEFEPTAGQLAEISKADMYMALGTGLDLEEAYLDKIADMNKGMQVVNTSEGVRFIPGDPHAWVSPRQAMIMVENIYEALSQKDPEHRDYYRQNMEAYLIELQSLDAEIAAAVSNSTGKGFLVYPANWGYFARDYGLDMLAIDEENKEPSPADLQRLVEEAKAKKIKTVFITPEFNADSARTMAAELGATMVEIDPLAPNYVENMRTAAGTIARSM